MPIMFNTTMGVLAGVALLLIPRFFALLRGEAPPLLLMSGPVSRSGWAATFGILGIVLFPLSLIMSVTHPLQAAKPYIDTLFGEPTLILAAILLAAAWYLGRSREDGVLDSERLRVALGPVSWIVFFLGIVLLVCTAAIIRFNAVGGAPVAEPLSGLLNAYPFIENLFFALLLYLPAALGCLAFPATVLRMNSSAWLILYWSWTIAGFGFAMFSALNFYTHTGLVMNTSNPTGPQFRW
jgi:hypothetical protein